jgi:cytidine deaminase
MQAKEFPLSPCAHCRTIFTETSNTKIAAFQESDVYLTTLTVTMMLVE